MKTEQLLKQLSVCISDVHDPTLKKEMTNLLTNLTLIINEMAERYWFLVKKLKS